MPFSVFKVTFLYQNSVYIPFHSHFSYMTSKLHLPTFHSPNAKSPAQTTKLNIVLYPKLTTCYIFMLKCFPE